MALLNVRLRSADTYSRFWTGEGIRLQVPSDKERLMTPANTQGSFHLHLRFSQNGGASD